MIGSYLIDVLIAASRKNSLNIKICAMGRSWEKAYARFSPYWDSPDFSFVCGDVNQGVPAGVPNADYVVHAASNTHPVAYSKYPIDTILTNIVGTHNLLQYAVASKCKRFIFTSSVEVYGENKGDYEKFVESDSGYIDCNTLRAGYPESKRTGEALCQAYIKQFGVDIVISRLPRVYGPTMLPSDTKAISQFLKKAVNGEDIVLKSEGNQYFSYIHVADAVTGLLYCLINGKSGEAYNIADEKSDITLKSLAKKIAAIAGKKVVFDLPDQVESEGYSKATKALMDSSKIRKIGWRSAIDIDRGLSSCFQIMTRGIEQG